MRPIKNDPAAIGSKKIGIDVFAFSHILAPLKIFCIRIKKGVKVADEQDICVDPVARGTTV